MGNLKKLKEIVNNVLLRIKCLNKKISNNEKKNLMYIFTKTTYFYRYYIYSTKRQIDKQDSSVSNVNYEPVLSK